MVVSNGLFGCQTWNVTQRHVEELEAVHSRLVRKLSRKSTSEVSRGDLMTYVEERGLNIMPIEFRMMKLQLRYLGNEVRVPPDHVRILPHSMLMRGYSGCSPRLPGGLE